MNEADFNKAARQEYNKIKRELTAAKVSAHKMKILDPIIENVSVMKVKLEELRSMLTDEDFMVEYNNGGGQKGIKENPIFKRYEAFFKTYMVGMDKILASIPDEKAEAKVLDKEDGPETVLDIVTAKHRGAA